jgi:hypothetical protein
MPHPLPPLPRTARTARIAPRAVAIAARARLSAATAAAGALMASATLLLTPRAAHASEDELYKMCLDAVYQLAASCLRSADSFIEGFACRWAGGVGYITCAVLEAIRHLLPGGLNAS